MNITADYVTGFSEGEAAFTFCRTKTKTQVRTAPRFSIRQRFDGRSVLDEIKAMFGVGVIYDCGRCGNTRPSAYYVVSSKIELPIVVQHFENFPLHGEQKRKVFEIWKDMVRIYTTSFRVNHSEMERLARDLTVLQLRPRGFKTR